VAFLVALAPAGCVCDACDLWEGFQLVSVSVEGLVDELLCLFGHPSFEYLDGVLVGDVMLGAVYRRLGLCQVTCN